MNPVSSWRRTNSQWSLPVSNSVLLFLLLFSCYTLTMTGRLRFGDEGERYLVAQSLVERHDWAIRIQPDLHTKIGVDGRNYSSYEFGSILPLMPFYLLGRAIYQALPTVDPYTTPLLFTGLANPFLTALTGVLVYQLILAFGSTTHNAISLALVFGLTTIAWPYSKAFEREALLGLTLLLAVLGLYRFRTTKHIGWFILASSSVAWFVFAKLANLILVPLLLGYLLGVMHAQSSWRRIVFSLVAFMLPTIALVGIQALTNQIRFGSFTDVGLAGNWGNPTAYFSLANLAEGLTGLLFSPAKSIFLYSPPTILFGFGWVALARRHRWEAMLIGALVVVSLLFNALNANWDQPSWWGPKYLVSITALLIIPLGSLVTESTPGGKATGNKWIVLLALGGGIVQTVAVLVDDREYLDLVGRGISLWQATDLLRFGAIESLVFYLTQDAFPFRINPIGLVLLTVCGLTIWGLHKASHTQSAVAHHSRITWLVLVVGSLGFLAAFTNWVVVLYPRVLSAQANTRFGAAERLLAAGRVCQAQQMYRFALDRGTTFQSQAITRYEQLVTRPQGISLTADDLMYQIETAHTIPPAKDYTTALTPEGALKLHIPGTRDATIMLVSTPIAVTPNTRYELSGWWKVLNIYGTRYASIVLYQDDGNWQSSQTTDIALLDETHGWQPFQSSITTLPTTQRVMVKVALWQTYGTVWVDNVRLVANPSPTPACK